MEHNIILIGKIVVTLSLIGIIGCLYNLILGKKIDDWKNHLYSTFLAVPLVVYAIFVLAYLVWTENITP